MKWFQQGQRDLINFGVCIYAFCQENK